MNEQSSNALLAEGNACSRRGGSGLGLIGLQDEQREGGVLVGALSDADVVVTVTDVAQCPIGRLRCVEALLPAD